MTGGDAPTLFDVEPVARARRDDPDTSHEAAASIRAPELRARQRDVLFVLRVNVACTDEELAVEYARTPGVAPQSPSGLRTRRAELVALGLVADTGERRRTASGRRSTVWKVTE